MAVTKILPIRSTIQKSVDYICNPDKTEWGLLIHSEHCTPQTAGQIFHHHLNQCRAGGNTIGRHLVQSFAIGEVDPDTAHEIGKLLAEEVLGGRYAYVFATHVDKGHVHNHFVWGAADIVSHKRYRSNKTTYHEIRNISDRLCNEYDLSVIIPQGVGKSYAEWQADKNGMSWKSKLKATIDETVSTSASFEDFIKQMEQQGYTIKRGKHIAFKAPDQERFTRAKRLGAEYTEDEIKSRIAKSKPPQQALPAEPKPQKLIQTPPQPQQAKKKTPQPQEPIPLMPQTPPPKSQPQKPPQQKPKSQTPQPQKSIKQKPQTPQSSAIFEDVALWESIIARADTAEIYSLMQEQGGYNTFLDEMAECRTIVETLDNGIKANDKQLTALEYLRKDLADLNRTRKVYNEYKALKKSTKLFAKRTAEKFYQSHKSDIDTHENALLDLRDYKRPLPTLKEVEERIAIGKEGNTTTKETYRLAKAKLDRFHLVHRKLSSVNREHEPKQPQRQNQRSKSYERG